MLKLANITTLLAVVGFLVSIPASAYEKGDFIVRVGAVSVEPDDGSDEIYGASGAYPSSGLDLYGEVESNTQLGLSFTYMMSSNWGVEVLAATPFKHDIELHSGIAGKILSRAATTKHLPPTISLQWYPMDSSSKLQPYIGLGVNYTLFFEEDMSSAFDAATSPAGAIADTDLELDDSIGLAAQLDDALRRELAQRLRTTADNLTDLS